MITPSYYMISSRKGLLAEAVVAMTMMDEGMLAGWRVAGKEEQFSTGVDIITHDGVLISVKCQNAGLKYGTHGEIGFELYSIKAASGEKEEHHFFSANSDVMLAILQGHNLYTFSYGQLRGYLGLHFNGELPKVRNLSSAVREAVQRDGGRYIDTYSGYIDVAHFMKHQPQVVHTKVQPEYIVAMDALSELDLNLDALRDTEYTVAMLRFVTTATRCKTNAVKSVILNGVARLTGYHA